MIKAGALVVASLLFATTLRPQALQQAEQTAARLPFGVGERLNYQIRAGFAGGSATLEIAALDTVRGRPALQAVFTTRGGIPGFRINDRFDSWIDIATVSTLRYKEDVHEGFYERRRDYHFYPEQKLYIEGRDTVATVERPVDYTSIFYLLRTLDLRVGLDTSFSNYFMADRNPIRLIVLGREHVKVPAGEFEAVIVRPIIKSKGMFSEGGDARVWISDDDRRIVLQIKAKVPGFPFGLNLYLREYRPPTTPRSPTP
jgi:hypothetical protein